MVPHQDPAEIASLVEKYFKKKCPKTVKMKISRHHGGLPYFCDPKKGFGPAAVRALSQAWDGKNRIVWPFLTKWLIAILNGRKVS